MRLAPIYGDLLDTDEPDSMRNVRRARRLLVRNGCLLTAAQFSRRSGISRAQLETRLNKRSMFVIVSGRDTLYPALFICQTRPASRLLRLARIMSAMNDPWAAYFELTYTFESLGNRSLLQVMHRAAGFRAAMRYARRLAGE